jgi:hypothetical protein
MTNIKVSFISKENKYILRFDIDALEHYFKNIHKQYIEVTWEEYTRELSISLKEYYYYMNHLIYDVMRVLEDDYNCPVFLLDDNPMDINILVEHE